MRCVCVEGAGCYTWFRDISCLIIHPNQASCTAPPSHSFIRHLTLSYPTLPMRHPVDPTKHGPPTESPLSRPSTLSLTHTDHLLLLLLHRSPSQHSTSVSLYPRVRVHCCCAQKRRRPANSLRAMAVRSTRPGPRRERVPWPGRRGGGAGRGPASLDLSPAPRGALPHAVRKPEGAPDVASINQTQTHAHTQHNEQPPYSSAGEARLPAPPERGAS